MLARVGARTRETGVRLAMGAAPVRLVRELLTETVVLSLGGAALGFAFAGWGTHALEALPPLRVRGLPRFNSRVLMLRQRCVEVCAPAGTVRCEAF